MAGKRKEKFRVFRKEEAGYDLRHSDFVIRVNMYDEGECELVFRTPANSLVLLLDKVGVRDLYGKLQTELRRGRQRDGKRNKPKKG